jgi:16S rRNA (guanine527-N7)-methyltransferase
VRLAPPEVDRLRRFVSLLDTWAPRLNLVSTRTTEETVHRHVLDSLAPATFLVPRETVADVGSGAGFPGVPLAVTRPGKVWLIESRRRRATFLRHVVRTLGLGNAVVFEGRAEDFREPVEAVVGRAVEERALAALASAILDSGGRLVAMRTARQAEGDWRGWTAIESRRYELPGGFFHEIVLLRHRST